MTSSSITSDEAQSLATQLYDALMQTIEPDLVSTVIGTLEEKYKGETDEQRKQRLARYEAAYKTFDVEMGKRMSDLQSHMSSLKHDAMKAEESEDRTDEDATMQSITSQFQ